MKYFDLPIFLVIGASEDRSKFGTKVLRCMVSHKKQCIPFNKRLPEIEGLQTVDSIPTFVKLLTTSFPSVPISMVGMNLITPPAVTLSLLKQGYDVGIRNFFCQPGTVDSAVEVMFRIAVDAHVLPLPTIYRPDLYYFLPTISILLIACCS